MKLSIKNFGAIKEGEIDLSKKVYVFVGYNNTGKTYISQLMYALNGQSFSKGITDKLGEDNDLGIKISNKCKKRRGAQSLSPANHSEMRQPRRSTAQSHRRQGNEGRNRRKGERERMEGRKERKEGGWAGGERLLQRQAAGFNQRRAVSTKASGFDKAGGTDANDCHNNVSTAILPTSLPFLPILRALLALEYVSAKTYPNETM